MASPIQLEPEVIRFRLWRQVFLLGIFLFLPIPLPTMPSHVLILVNSLWGSLFFLTLSHWYFPGFWGVFWFLSLVIAGVCFFKVSIFWVAPLLVLWRVWVSVAARRLKVLSLVPLVFFCVPILFYNSQAVAQVTNLESKSLIKPGSALFEPRESVLATPANLTGVATLKLKDITSCGIVDKIPWKFRPDGRKSRLLLTDTLRFQTEASFQLWDIYQIMDNEGFISFVFRRTLASGKQESIIVKDTIYNKVIDTPRGNKTIESQNLKSLVNRQALAFYHEDGSSIIYSPSSVGRSSLTLQQGQVGGGRILPPVFLRGNYCDRPDDEENSDAQNRRAVQASPGSTPSGTQGGSGVGGASK